MMMMMMIALTTKTDKTQRYGQPVVTDVTGRDINNRSKITAAPCMTDMVLLRHMTLDLDI